MSSNEDMENTRRLSGFMEKFINAILVAIPLAGAFFILDIPSRIGMPILREQYYGLFFALTLPCIFWMLPATERSRRGIAWYDHLLAAAAFITGMYVAFFYEDVLRTLGEYTPMRIGLSIVAIVTVLEAVRRTAGNILFILGLLFILYAHYAEYVPGIFGGAGTAWPELFTYLYLDGNSLFGMSLGVSAVVVLAFILFGNLMFGVGGGEFLSNFAMAIFGGFRGGPAKMAIVASSLFGMLTGSAAANVASTGVFTIPLMKRIGYPAHIAGAVEAVASTGGSLTPPVMGAAAFIIAEFTGIPYATVAIASILPAVLYYAGVFIQVDLEAGKKGMVGLPRNELPSLRKTLHQAYLFVVPFTALLIALFVFGQSPEMSAFWGILAVFACALVRKETRNLTWVVTALNHTGKAMLSLTAIVAMAGLVIGVINLCGLGFILPMFLSQIAGDNLFLVLVIVAVTSIILGMGMPTVAVYILLGVLMGPTLVEAGVPVLAAHLFIQYFGTVSQFTPPICIASFAAASIADAPQMKTAFASMRMGALAYPAPFLFAYSQVFLMEGQPWEICWAMLTALFACFLLGCALVGYFKRPIPMWKRILLIPFSGLLLTATSSDQLLTGLLQDCTGLLAGIIFVALELHAARHARTV